MNRSLQWGVLLPTADPFGSGAFPVVAAARLAEELGFDALWVGDHLVCPAPMLDSLCALSAAAAATTGIQLGLSVLQLGLRHLVWTAKQLATIDALAPGRLRLGVGVGGEFEEEFTSAGVSRATRGQRLDEMLEILPALLRGQPVDHRGPHVAVSTPGLRPGVSVLPRVTVGGRSDAALWRAARYGDQWMGMWHDSAVVRDCADRLAVLAGEQGRPVPGVAMLVLVNVNDDVEVARSEATAALAGQYRLPLRVVERWTAYGPTEDVAKMLVDYRDAGATELVLLPASPDFMGQYERLAAVRQLLSG